MPSTPPVPDTMDMNFELVGHQSANLAPVKPLRHAPGPDQVDNFLEDEKAREARDDIRHELPRSQGLTAERHSWRTGNLGRTEQ